MEVEGPEALESVGRPSASVLSHGVDDPRGHQTVGGKTTPRGTSKVVQKKKKKPPQAAPILQKPNFAIKKNYTKDKPPPDGQRVLIVLDQCSSSRDYLH